MTPYQLPERPRRTPYRTPDGFMADMEERIIARATAPRRSGRLRLVLRATAVAATLAAAVTIAVSYMHSSEPQVAETDYIAAFDRLSDSDRAYLVDTYQDDIFLTSYQSSAL